MYQSQHNGTSVTNRDYTPVLSTWNQTPAADQLEMNVRFTSLYNGNIAMMSTNMLYLQEAQNIVASQPVGLGGLQKSHMVNYYKYDQLQRITRMQSTFPQSGDVSLDAYYEAYQYDFNGNIRSLTRNNSLGTTIDALAYKYQTLANNPSQLVSNRLLDVADASMNAAGFKGNKAALNTANQYEYDADGNLTHDAIEGITITWNATGKVSSVTKTDGTYMQFTYDGMGNRISKLVKPAGITKAGYELYVRDAGGNILASYRGEIDTYTPHTTVDNAVVQLETHYIYASNRIGQNKNTTNTMLNRANIHYELTNHLGNVLVVVTANKLEIAGGNYIPEIVSTTDYTPFGMQMEGRSWNSSEYKFGFQGQEAENELYGAGNASFFKYRISDNRLGRFFAIDPLAAEYPHNSPYAFSENRVIDGVELEGLEVEVINQTTYTDEITNMTYTFENFNVNYDLPQSNNIILNQIDYTTGLSNTSVLEPAVITPKPSQIQQANNKTAANNAITLNKNKPITPTKSSNICYDCSRFELDWGEGIDNGQGSVDKFADKYIGYPVGKTMYYYATTFSGLGLVDIAAHAMEGNYQQAGVSAGLNITNEAIGKGMKHFTAPLQLFIDLKEYYEDE